MKTIGLIGGLSWESSIEYYRIINQETQKRLGGLHSAKCLMHSFDFAEIEALQAAGDWKAATERMIAAARSLEGAGAGCIVICSNTMHRMAEDVAAAVDLPLIHIADATAAVILADGLQTIGLLGTRYTMEQEFYKGRMVDRFGLSVLIPDAERSRHCASHHLRRTCAGRDHVRVTCFVSGGDRELAQRGRPGGHSRLHGNRPADQAGGLSHPQLRYDLSACACRGGVGFGHLTYPGQSHQNHCAPICELLKR